MGIAGDIVYIRGIQYKIIALRRSIDGGIENVSRHLGRLPVREEIHKLRCFTYCGTIFETLFDKIEDDL